MLEVLSRPDSPLANIRAVLTSWEQNACTGGIRGCLLANSLAELGDRDKELSPILARMVKRMEDAFSAALDRAKEAGELSADSNPRAIARLIVTVGQGLAVLGKVQTGKTHARDVMRSLDALLH